MMVQQRTRLLLGTVLALSWLLVYAVDLELRVVDKNGWIHTSRDDNFYADDSQSSSQRSGQASPPEPSGGLMVSPSSPDPSSELSSELNKTIPSSPILIASAAAPGDHARENTAAKLPAL